jgi:hypothetical protein
MNSPNSLESNILEWLNKQGFPLEMLVYSKVRKLTGWHYIDPETNASREIDIICTADEPRGLLEVNFVIECKGTKKPWLLFTSESAATGFHRLDSFGILSAKAYSGILEKTFLLLQDEDFEIAKSIPWLWKEGRVGYSIFQAFDGKGDTPYTANLSAIKASLWLKENSVWQSSEKRKFSIAFPIIVTSSPLFECYLDESGEVQLKPIDSGFCFFQQYIDGFTGTCVQIVSERFLDDFLKECNLLVEKLFQILSSDVNEEWENLLNSIREKYS